jgi:hypothetical protein
MNDRSDERDLRALASMCRRQAKGATTHGAANALVSMADGYEKQADRLHGAEPTPPEARNGTPSPKAK